MSLKKEQVEGKKDKIEKSEKTKEETSSILFKGDKREEMKDSWCDISSPLNSLSSEEKFEALKMENEGSLVYKMQSQFFNFLTITFGTKSNHGMKAKQEDMGKEISAGYEDTSISLCLNPFLLCREFSFKDLNFNQELGFNLHQNIKF
ncbi:hypothetical protein M9H77_26819 [Catharanthus roseus]|uniref:Uncharacterized protein n=1 Tax=Catharanthus roseus TaxID=4058 RepID=A0ACC0ABR6_CATRO|nr:hypothetical protein M9H77_26819 [Catharanthus roseus]